MATPSAPMQAYWSAWVDTVCDESQTLGAVLRSARPIDMREDTLVIEVFHEFHRTQLQKPSMLQVLRDAMQVVEEQFVVQQLAIKTADTPAVEAVLLQLAEETLGSEETAES